MSTTESDPYNGARAGLRVLHVLTSDHRRGAESFAVELAKGLAQRGHRTRPVALAGSGADRVLAVPVLGARPRSLRTLLTLRARMAGADVVVAHGSTTLSACVLAGLGRPGRSAPPLVYVNIGDPSYWSNTAARRARTRLFLGRVDAVVARSDRSADQLHRIFHVPERQVTVIGNGRRSALFPRADGAATTAARHRFGLDPDARWVTYLGALSPEKRVDVLIEALGELPDFRLLVAGDGPDRARLEALAAQVCAGRVHFAGAVDDPAVALAAADVVALTSDSEGLPGVLVEAGLVGRPSVATDVGFVSDIVRDGQTGVLVPPGSPAATATAIRIAYDRRTELGDAAHARCTEQFELGGVVERWDRLLCGVTGDRGVPAVRVLHVINSLRLGGGAENSLVQLLPQLTRRGVSSRVVVLARPEAHGVELLRGHGVEVVAVLGSLPRRWFLTVREIRRTCPDLVHTTLFEAGLVGRLAARCTGTPAVASWVNSTYGPRAMAAADSAWKKRVIRDVDRALYRRLTCAVHALTEAGARSAEAELGVPRSLVTVIPRARDRVVLGEPSPSRRAAVRTGLGLDPDGLVLLNVGRQERQKAQVDLVAAFAKVLAAHPEAVLLIAGRDGEASGALRDAIDRHGVGHAVRLLGLRRDVPDLLCAADVFVFSSHWEGLGGAVLEAMAMEVAVVAYNVPAVAEVLGGHSTVVPIGDTHALAQAVLDVVALEPAERAARVGAARARFEAEFGIDAVTRRTAAWYREVARAHRRRRPRAGSGE